MFKNQDGGINMLKKFFGAICAVLAMCVLITGCVSDSQYAELEEKVGALEKEIESLSERIAAQEQDSQMAAPEEMHEEADKNKNSEYMEACAILFGTDFDPKAQFAEGEQYRLYIDEDKCTLRYQTSENYYAEITECDFSKDVFYVLLNTICSQDLEKFENPIDSNGKVIYEIQPYAIGLDMGGRNEIYFKNPANMDEIIEKFESLRDSALQ